MEIIVRARSKDKCRKKAMPNTQIGKKCNTRHCQQPNSNETCTLNEASGGNKIPSMA